MSTCSVQGAILHQRCTCAWDLGGRSLGPRASQTSTDQAAVDRSLIHLRKGEENEEKTRERKRAKGQAGGVPGSSFQRRGSWQRRRSGRHRGQGGVGRVLQGRPGAGTLLPSLWPVRFRTSQAASFPSGSLRGQLHRLMELPAETLFNFFTLRPAFLQPDFNLPFYISLSSP